MPIIEIYTQGIESDDDVIDEVYNSLRTVLNVKEGARFAFINVYKTDKIFFPKTLFDINYSDNFIFIKITFNKGRSTSQKKELFNDISSRLEAKCGIPRSDCAICLIENSPENWSFGNGQMQFIH